MLTGDHTEILAFVAQHDPDDSKVFALVKDMEHFAGFIGLEAVTTIGERRRADDLCAALNQYVYEKDAALGFHARLRASLGDEPEGVHAAVQRFLDRIRRSANVYEDSPLIGISPFGSFPLSACPPDGCPACGQCVNSCRDCVVCAGYSEECECDVPMPPRTASLIHSAAAVYAGEIHDRAEEIPPAIPLKPHDALWPVPRVARWQSQDFYRRLAHAFEDIARDIDKGGLPEPRNVAEEIALHLVLKRAAGIVADDSHEFEFWTGGMPASRFDFDFGLLHEILFQGRDYEYAYLDPRTRVAKPGDLEHWFEDFDYVDPREPHRGHRR